MNWTRIWTGSVVSSAALWLFDIGNLVLTQRFFVSEPNLTWSEIVSIAGSLIVPSLVMGFLLSWLYVLARPRLGPGPKTALIMGSIGFAFANPQFFSLTVWVTSFEGALIMMVTTWLKFAIATYLAGWQYIEKAP